MTECCAAASREEILAILNCAFADRFHSMAAYILESGAYASGNDEALRRTIAKIAEYDRETAQRIADTIEDLEGIPQAPAYRHIFAEMNYLSLDYLKTTLREELTRQRETYERQLPQIHNCAAARNILFSLSQALRDQIASLA